MAADDVARFESVCRALQHIPSKQAADEELTALRSNPAALTIARGVLERSSDMLAQFQAALLTKEVVVRSWRNIGVPDRQALRDWVFGFLSARCEGLQPAVAQQLVVLTALMWKRGWCDDFKAEQPMLVEHVRGLLSAPGRAYRLLGAKLMLTLVQEFDATSTGRASALGMPHEFHAAAAADFQKAALQELFGVTVKAFFDFVVATAGACAQAGAAAGFTPAAAPAGGVGGPAPPMPGHMTSPGGPPVHHLDAQLAQALLSCLIECLQWDFAGSGSSRAAGASRSEQRYPPRVSPGRGWGPLLADPDNSLLSALFTLYSLSRNRYTIGDSETGRLTRQALLHLAALHGDVFTCTTDAESAAKRALHSAALLRGLASLLSHPVTADAPALSAAAAGGRPPQPALLVVEAEAAAASSGGAGASPTSPRPKFAVPETWANVGDEEAGDTAAALSLLVRNQRIAFLYQHCEALLAPVLSQAAAATCGLIGVMERAAAQVQAAVAGATSAGAAEGSLRRARDRVELFLSTRYTELRESLDAFVGLWTAVVAECRESAEEARRANRKLAAATAGAGSVGFAAAVDPLAGLSATVRECCGTVYSQLIQARLALSTSIIRCEIDDDDPFDDGSVLVDHMEAVAALGRFHPQAAITTLTTALQRSLSRLQTIVATNDASTAWAAKGVLDPDVETSCCSEELWWLVGYAGYLLADEACGEVPAVPSSLNELSHASFDAAVAAAGPAGAASLAAIASYDPVISLASAVMAVVNYETGRLVSSSYGGGVPAGLSPLLYRQLLWFLARWARTYLATDEEALGHEGAASPALVAAYGSTATVASTAAAAVSSAASLIPSPAGLLAAPLPPQDPSEAGALVGPRRVLEYIVQTAAVALALWARAEEDIVNHGLWLLRSLTNNRPAAALLLLSPSWAALVEGVLAVISAGPGQRPAPVSLAIAATAGGWTAVSPALLDLTPEAQGKLFGTLFAPVDSFLAPPAAYGPGEDGVAASKRLANAHASAMLAVLHSRLGALLSSSAFGSAPTKPPMPREVERLVCMHGGAATARPSAPEGWHFPGTLPLLQACPALVSTYLPAPGFTDLVVRLLRFVVDFISHSCDLASLSVEQARLVYGACTAIFVAYCTSPATAAAMSSASAKASTGGALKTQAKAGDDGAVAAPSMGTAATTISRKGGGSSSSSSNSGAGLTAALEEEDAARGVLALLDILSAIIDKEDLDFSASGAGAAAEGHEDAILIGAVTETVTTGLSLVLPMITPPLLQYPRIGRAFIDVVEHLATSHPHQMARLDTPVFSALLSSLCAAVNAPDKSVVSTALSAMASLAAHHAVCRTSGFAFPNVGLTQQMAALPGLFSILVGGVLRLTMGPEVLPRELLTRAANVVLSVVAADPQGYASTVQSLIDTAGDPATRARLADEFTKLTSSNGLVLGDLRRPNKLRFHANFESFVNAVRSFTSIK